MKAVNARISNSWDAEQNGEGESAGRPFLSDQMGITHRVRLHPLGHIVLAAVLPGAEPEQIQPDMVLARLGDDGIDDGVVELSRLWFELLQ